MPVLGTAKHAFVSGGKIGSKDNPIRSDADMLAWTQTQTGGKIGGVVYIQESTVNSGNPYQVYCEYKNSKCQAMAAVWASKDATASNWSGNSSNYQRWIIVNNPNDASNDWGTGTHTFNDNYDFWGYATNDKSARSRIWFELAKNNSYFKFIGHDQNNDLFYTMRSTKAWGVRMKDPNDGGDGSDNYFNNGGSESPTVRVFTESITSNVVADGGGTAVFQNTRWKNLGLGVTDGEGTSANSNDVIMLVANSRGNAGADGTIGVGSDGFGVNDGYTGIGGKRSQVSGNFPASYTWNANTGNTSQADSIAGNILDPANHNGNIQFDTDAAILMFVAPF